MKTVKLGDVATVERRGIQPDQILGDTAYLGLEHIEKGGTILEYPTAAKSDLRSTKFQFTENHVLYGKLRPYLAKIALPDRKGVCSTDILPVLPGAELDRSYLAHYLRQGPLVEFATSRASGANLPRLSPKQLEQFPVPLPSLKEQQRIAAILDKADAIRTKRRQALHIQRSLVAAQFSLRFGDPMGSSQRFPKRRLGDISRIIRGASPRPAGDPRYFGGEIPWLKISDLTAEPSSTVRDIRETVTEAGAEKSVLLPSNTLILSNSATVGIAKIIEPASCIHDGFLAFLDLGEDVDKRWLQAALEFSRRRITSLAPEGTQKNLNGPIVKGIKMQIPPIDLQLEFIEEAQKIDKIIAGTTRALDHEDALFASLQSRAFKGEL